MNKSAPHAGRTGWRTPAWNAAVFLLSGAAAVVAAPREDPPRESKPPQAESAQSSGTPGTPEFPAKMLLSPAEDLVGWQLLSGPDVAQHWRQYRGTGFPERGWVMTPAGTLQLSAGGGDLISNEQYEDFELVFEWRTGHRGNSGVMFRVREAQAAPWETGPEYQLLDDNGQGAAPTADWSAGALYGLASPRPNKRLAEQGQFNHSRIVFDGGRLAHWMNERLIVEIPDIDDASFRQRIARSKFAEMESFAAPGKGHLALQDHGDAFEFRRIRIRPLPPEDQRDPSLRREQPSVEVLGSLTGLLMRAAEQPPTLLFLGDDLMAGWRTTGRDIWDRGLARLGAVSLAGEGELPAHTLFKLDYPEFLSGKPRAVIIRFGSIERNHPGADAPAIVRSIAELVAVVRTRSPDSVVLLHVPYVGPADQEGHDVRVALRDLLPMLADGVNVRAIMEEGPLRAAPATYTQWRRALARMLAQYDLDLEAAMNSGPVR